LSAFELITYQPIDKPDVTIHVRIEDESVWLTQLQMMGLFSSTKQNVSLHINNVFKEKELIKDATVKEYLTVQMEGARKVRRKILLYNLDVIISVGYRIKSQRGTQFRIWATSVLRNYLLKGYAFQQRIERIEKQVAKHEGQLEELIQSALPPKEGIFYEGQIFDAHKFVSSIIRKAEKSIIVIDNYIDDTVLTLLSKRKKGVNAIIYTKKVTRQLQLDIDKFNAQYEQVEVHQFSKSHDRFLIIDEQEIYLIGASLKDLGKKWFAFSKITIDISYLLNQLKD
jgi:hypothetical protein